ncbi:hypothetical protein PILCRDRAFT_1520 [Piloderma croceum F 1598]|uniref:Uncharacterized protein n=1 Tax=Piloderma croceum (strain F 1598) TaxID=765440 RepID=A0A0C3BUF8_PILCF|nr:hypothetical protein PILCRDRAFT_1520 [Piloderma croceum F 1598]
MPAYSNLFSSGLLAPRQGLCDSRAHTPTPADTPMLTPTTPGDPIDRFLTPTPTQNFSSNVIQVSPGPSGNNPFDTRTNTNTTELRPRLRKRRSSLSVTTNPMGNIKSSGRSAGHALQRTGLMSPSRMRSGSVGEFGNGNIASEETSLAGRMWSGCIGGVLRPKRVIRKPSDPAPTAPLPPLPSQPPLSPSKLAFPSLQPLLVAPNPRRPLAHRLNSAENQLLHSHLLASSPSITTTGTALGLADPDFNTKLGLAVSDSPFSSSVSPASGLKSPVLVTESSALGTPFQYHYQKIDEAMQEN